MATNGSRLSGSVRIRVLERDGYRCVYCGATSQEARLHVDHVVSVSRGGTDASTNLVTACFDCNNGKRARTIQLPDHVHPASVGERLVRARRPSSGPAGAQWRTEARRRWPDMWDMVTAVEGNARYASVTWCAGLLVHLIDEPRLWSDACGHSCWRDHEIVDLSQPEVLDPEVERRRMYEREAHFNRCRICDFVFDGRAAGDAIERGSLRCIKAAKPESQRLRALSVATS